LKNRTEQLFAVVAPGLEEVCARELQLLGIDPIRIVGGGVEFEGGLREIYLANLWLRSAGRVLVRLGTVKSRDFPDLYHKALRLPWGRFVRSDKAVQVRVGSRRSRLNHSGRIIKTLSDAINRALGRDGTPEGRQQLVLAQFEDDVCRLSVDSSGELLHRRGYRVETALAPLRETLAAGILLKLGWDGSSPLVDPMCGSGTFVIEAALLAGNRPPGMARQFAFMDWPGFRPGLWDALHIEARRVERSVKVPLCGGEREPEALAAAHRNAARAGVEPLTQLVQQELEQFVAPSGQGLVVCNPPYGKRIGRNEDLRLLFRLFGSVLRNRFPGWQVAFICPDNHLAKATGLTLTRLDTLHNGGIPVALWTATPEGCPRKKGPAAKPSDRSIFPYVFDE
jgi:23S rRNA (guanine2445-N2)-methyltransferase